LIACQLARERFSIPTIIARADTPQLVSALQSMNVSVVQPAMAVALALEGALHFPAAFNVLMDKGDNVEVLDVPLENPVCFGRPLRQLRLPGDALVLGIQRQGEVLVPHGDTVLHRDDVLMLVGSPESLEEGKGWLSR
jgi:Trk K+ transport system NAD-binding subunit